MLQLPQLFTSKSTGELGAPVGIGIWAVTVIEPVLAHRATELVGAQRHHVWVRRAHVPTALAQVPIRECVCLLT